MPTLSVGEVTPQMMVLGLVIQQRDTVAGVARRLADQFAFARFPRGSAHNNVPRLVEKGFVRLVEEGPPDEPTRNLYEATPEGIEHFRKWIISAELPPVVRDAMLCKLELLEREDLADLLLIVRQQEESFTFAYDLARSKVLKEHDARQTRRQPTDWRVKLRGIRYRDEANLWGLMARRLERLGDELEGLLKEISHSKGSG